MVVARSGEMRAARNYLSSSKVVCYDAQIKSNDTRRFTDIHGRGFENRKEEMFTALTAYFLVCVMRTFSEM